MKRSIKCAISVVMAICVMSSIVIIASAGYASGSLGDSNVSALTTISAYNATASTTSSQNATTIIVYATYSWVNTNTLATGSSDKYAGGSGRLAEVNFSVSSPNRSVKVSADHKVVYQAQTWTTKTSATY